MHVWHLRFAGPAASAKPEQSNLAVLLVKK
jgi:hypothetical protein